MRNIIGCSLISLLLIIQSLNAQNNPGKGKEHTFKLSGKIVDNERNPVGYATITIYDVIDSALVEGGISNENGKFEFQLEPGVYFVKINFLSFREVTLPDININEDLDLGDITLTPDVRQLQEVEVRAEKSTVELKLDKRVFNVGKDLVNKGNNALEILDNVPSVAVDVDGNVKLRGSENVQILIDGKPSVLIGNDPATALRMLQGNMIDRIEVITNPSARYDATGEAGIINIILRKEREAGVNGSFDLTAGYPHHYSGAYNLNFRRNWINLFSSYSIHYRKHPGSGSTHREYTSADTAFVYDAIRKHERGGLGNTIRLGSDFFINPKNTLTISGVYSYQNGKNTAELNYTDWENDVIIATTQRSEEETEIQHELEFSVNYTKALKPKDGKFTIDLQWNNSDDTETSDITTSLLSPSVMNSYQQTSNTEDERLWLFQSDLVIPFHEGKGKFETGVKSTLRVIENAFSVEQLNDDAIWEELPGFNDHFVYDEKIIAYYVMAGDKIKKFGWQAGLRTEYTNISTELKKSGQENQKDYIDFFPSAHLSYQFNPMNELQISYTRRLTRPWFRMLMPFSSFSDSRNYWRGNPDLDPEYTHSTDFNYLRRFEKGNFMAGVYYRYTTNVMERLFLVDSNGVTNMTFKNLSKRNAYGIEFNSNIQLLQWWRFNGNVDFFHALTTGEVDKRKMESETVSARLRLSSKMTILKKLDNQLSFNYHAPAKTTQGKQKAQYSFDLALSMDILKNNGTITFTIRDMFNTRKFRSTINDAGLVAENEFQWRSRVFLLSFNYRLNQKGKPNQGQRGFNGDFEPAGF